MKQFLVQEMYALFTMEVEKQETSFTSVSQIIAFLQKCIEQDELATFITVFDHYQHTKSLSSGQIGEGILDAQNIVFCFGITLPSPQSLAVRPRSIGVAEMEDRFVVTFMEAPMPVANVAMEGWAKSLIDIN